MSRQFKNLRGLLTCGLESSAKEQLGSEDAQRTCWRAVSGSFQQVLLRWAVR